MKKTRNIFNDSLDVNKRKVCVFCVGQFLKGCIQRIEDTFEILALIDNDVEKSNRMFYGYKCILPKDIEKYAPDLIIIATDDEEIILNIKKQLLLVYAGGVRSYKEFFESKKYKLFEISKRAYYIDALGNELIIEDGAYIKLIEICGTAAQNNKIIIKKNVCVFEKIYVWISGSGNCLEIGDNTTVHSCKAYLGEEGRISIGRDCMMSSDIEFFQYASHPIFDKISHQRLNDSKNIIIGDHVWIGEKVVLMPGFLIGEGSVVGLGAISSAHFGENLIIAGSPARIIREGIEWKRDALGLYKLDRLEDSRYGY